MNISEINNKTQEGRLLIMALAKLSSTCLYSDKEPDDILKVLENMSDTMNWEE